MKHTSFLRWLLSLLVTIGGARSASALVPDEIALVVNSNEPAGLQLAKLYAEQRHIPDDRIISLDLPKTDELPNRQYGEQVVPQVREFLHGKQLDNKVKCLVTFYGVPLRIGGRVNTPEESRELEDLRQQLLKMADRIQPSVEAVEAIVVQLDPGYKHPVANDLESLQRRRAIAFNEFSQQLETIPDKNAKTQWALKFLDAASPLLGDYARLKKMAVEVASATTATQPANTHNLDVANAEYTRQVTAAGALEDTPYDADAREKLRQSLLKTSGLVAYTQLIEDQLDYLIPDQSGAAFDNELAMLHWNAYPHRGWFTNPLNTMLTRTPPRVQTLMVSRLDGPDVDTVKGIIAHSINTEKDGLKGKVVIDSLGVRSGEEKPDQRGYGQYDQYLRNLNTLLTERSKLQVVLDEKPAVLPPNSVDGVALYVGWYSVHNYVPSCKFVPGAVGYHIASFELVSLRAPNEAGWVRGLLLDGVVGTLGPVAEPYLQSFPRPDDYFPLLLTGKLTLAEVYWKTQPTVSWMMTCVGDPLYNPYKTNPALKESDLPGRLRTVLSQSMQ